MSTTLLLTLVVIPCLMLLGHVMAMKYKMAYNPAKGRDGLPLTRCMLLWGMLTISMTLVATAITIILGVKLSWWNHGMYWGLIHLTGGKIAWDTGRTNDLRTSMEDCRGVLRTHVRVAETLHVLVTRLCEARDASMGLLERFWRNKDRGSNDPN